MPDLTTPIFSFTEPTVGADNGTWGGILNTDLTNLDTYLGVLRQAAKAVTVGATTTLDFNSPASVFTFTVNQATTIAFANVPANITTQQLSTMFVAIITNGGAFTITWPASVTWSGGTAPAFQAAGTDVVVGWSPNNGTNWYLAILSTNLRASVSKVGQLGQLSTGSLTEVSLGTVTVPAGKLATNGDHLRIHIAGQTPSGQTATVKVKFGATNVVTLNPSSSGGVFDVWVTVTRLTGTTQVANANELWTNTTLGSTIERTSPAETLANAVTLDFRAASPSGQTITLDYATVEAITQ